MVSQAISRRSFVRHMGGGLALAGLFTACGPLGPATSGDAPKSVLKPTAAPGQAKKGGTLACAVLVGPKTTNPYPSTPATGSFRNGMFSTLVRIDSKAQPQPDLAESWVISEDRLTLTFKLRQGVTFHSGRPFSAEEAKWSIDYALDLRNAAQVGAGLKGAQASVVDAATLELKLPDVLPHVFSLLSDVQVIDPQSDVATNAAGTGPFKLDGLNPGDEMRLVRNKQYWRTDQPYLDAFTIKAFPDISSGLVALESGAVGLAMCPENEVQRIKSGTQTTVTIIPGSGNSDVLISVLNPPLSNQRVRQAINLALDRKRFTETQLYGLAEPTYIMWPRRSPAWDASLDVGEFNLDKARRLLAEAGYPNGFETRIQCSSALQQVNQFAPIIQSDLAKIGVKASIEVLEASQAAPMALQGKFTELFAFSYTFADQDPALVFTAPAFWSVGNSEHFESDEYRQLVELARREPDWDKRLRLYRQIATFIKDQAFVLPLATSFTPWAHRSNVHGLVKAGLGNFPQLEDLWLE